MMIWMNCLAQHGYELLYKTQPGAFRRVKSPNRPAPFHVAGDARDAQESWYANQGRGGGDIDGRSEAGKVSEGGDKGSETAKS